MGIKSGCHYPAFKIFVFLNFPEALSTPLTPIPNCSLLLAEYTGVFVQAESHFQFLSGLLSLVFQWSWAWILPSSMTNLSLGDSWFIFFPTSRPPYKTADQVFHLSIHIQLSNQS